MYINPNIQKVVLQIWIQTDDALLDCRRISRHAYESHQMNKVQIEAILAQTKKAIFFEKDQKRYICISSVGCCVYTPDGVVITAYPRKDYNREMCEFVRFLNIS